MGKPESVGAGFNDSEIGDGEAGFRGDCTIPAAPIKMWADVPGSQYWTSINMIMNYLRTTTDTGNKMTDYLMKGLQNTIDNGYNIEKVSYLLD